MKSLRKIISFSLVLIMVFSTFTNVTANSNIQLVVDGNPVVFTDAYPFVENGRTLVPVRALAEAMEATVDWNGETSTITLTKGEFSLSLKIGENKTAFGNGKETITKDMDTKAIVINGRTYIPARYVGYGLGYSVEWKEPIVYYTFINKQTTDFQIDNKETPESNNKYNTEWVWHKPQLPLSKPPYEFHYPARKGYGDILIIDGSKGNIDKETGVRPSTLPGYDISPVNVIIESDEEKYALSNDFTPEENFKRFVSLYEDKTGNEVTFSQEGENYALEKMGYFTTYLGYKNDGIIGKATDFELENKKYYWFDSRSVMADTTMFYSYTDSGTTTACYSDHTPRSESCSKNMLFVLNEFLGETGQKIWTLMHDYYNHTNHFYYPPNTLWPTGVGNISKAINKEDCEKYGLNFVDCKFIKTTHRYKFTIKTEKQYIHILFLPLLDYGQALGGYVVLFDEIE